MKNASEWNQLFSASGAFFFAIIFIMEELLLPLFS